MPTTTAQLRRVIITYPDLDILLLVSLKLMWFLSNVLIIQLLLISMRQKQSELHFAYSNWYFRNCLVQHPAVNSLIRLFELWASIVLVCWYV